MVLVEGVVTGKVELFEEVGSQVCLDALRMLDWLLLSCHQECGCTNPLVPVNKDAQTRSGDTAPALTFKPPVQ